eukprot:1544013-Prorocentrum_lima.AAC.1
MRMVNGSTKTLKAMRMKTQPMKRRVIGLNRRVIVMKMMVVSCKLKYYLKQSHNFQVGQH